jgi:hypothetical protein
MLVCVMRLCVCGQAITSLCSASDAAVPKELIRLMQRGAHLPPPHTHTHAHAHKHTLPLCPFYCRAALAAHAVVARRMCPMPLAFRRGCAGKQVWLWFLPHMHPKKKLKRRRFKIQVPDSRPGLLGWVLRGGGLVLWGGAFARAAPCVSSHPFACLRVRLLQLSVAVSDLHMEYFSKRLHGLKEWTVSFDRVGVVRNGLPLGFTPCVAFAGSVLYVCANCARSCVVKPQSRVSLPLVAFAFVLANASGFGLFKAMPSATKSVCVDLDSQ